MFFSRETLPVGGDFEDFYQQWRAAPRTKRMDQDPMIGYFGGQSAESGTSISLRTPVINIYNENTLWAEVTYWVPNTMALTGEEKNVHLNVILTYQDVPVTLEPEQAENGGAVESIGPTPMPGRWTPWRTARSSGISLKTLTMRTRTI